MQTVNPVMITQKPQILETVFQAEKDPHGADAALGDVVWDTGDYNARPAGHGSSRNTSLLLTAQRRE
ncbi:MAG: hypothetical protein ABSH28_00075 [Acidobacteriota bacterium]